MIDLQSNILIFVNHFSYFGVFILLAVIAIIPIPEELVLLLIGYFAGFGFADIKFLIPVSIAGVLVGDNILFLLSRHKNHIINKFKKKIAPKQFTKYELKMKDHIGKTIFLLRFIIGLRFLSPVIAGSTNVEWKKFFIYNTLAVLIFVPFFIIIGYNFNTILSLIIEDVSLIKNIVIIVVLSIIVISIIHKVKKKFFKREEN